jgi:hypothetical protein
MYANIKLTPNDVALLQATKKLSLFYRLYKKYSPTILLLGLIQRNDTLVYNINISDVMK